MGSSLSCLCPSENTSALLIKPNGKVLRVKAGTRVKDIRAFNPHHAIVSCHGGSSSSFLPDSFQLKGDEAYALVEEGKHEPLNLKTLMKLAKLRERGGPRAKVSANDDRDGKSSGGNKVGVVQVLLLQDASLEYRRSSAWKPALHTIPEILSPDVL